MSEDLLLRTDRAFRRKAGGPASISLGAWWIHTAINSLSLNPRS